MNKAVALLAVVCMAGFAQAAPNLAAIREKIASLKRGGGGDSDCDSNWPYGWMEFAQLIGRCDGAYQFFTLINYFPSEGIIVEACPHVMNAAADLQGVSQAALEAAQPEVRSFFPLMQCVNLQAERETVAVLRAINGETENPFEDGAAPLFAKCMEVFQSVKNEQDKMGKDADKIDETLGGSKRSKINAALRQLINYAKKN